MWLLITQLRACPLLDCGIKIHLDVVIGSSGCVFSLEKNLGVALKNAFQQKDQMWYQYLVAIYFYTIWQNTLSFSTTRLIWFSSEFICLVGLLCLLQSFQTKQELFIWCHIPQSPGVLMCRRELRALSSLISWVLFCAWHSQTGDKTQSWVHLSGQGALNTKNSFDLVDVNANFYHSGLNTFWARLEKIRAWCHDQVTVGSQSKFVLSGL